MIKRRNTPGHGLGASWLSYRAWWSSKAYTGIWRSGRTGRDTAVVLPGPPRYPIPVPKNIVICWHHGEILELANLLLKGNPPPGWPTEPWPPDVFGWLLWLHYDEHEKVTSPPSGCYR